MKKLITLFLIILIGLLFTSQNVFADSVTWSLATSTAVTTQGTNMTGSAQTIGAGMGAVSYASTFQTFPSKTWPTTVTLPPTGTTYLSFPIGPNSGNDLNITQLQLTGWVQNGSGTITFNAYLYDGTNYTTLSGGLAISSTSSTGPTSASLTVSTSVPDGSTYYIYLFPTGSTRTPHIKNFIITGTVTPTPVEMTTYSATVKGQTVTLNWATATEIQNSGWNIERSTGNSQWTKIGFVQGNGNSNSPHQYSYVDKSIKQNGEYIYRLKQIDVNGTTVYTREVEAVINVPLTYSLNQNYPNPFNPSTTISYDIPTAGKVTIKVYDILGNEITTLVNGEKAAGRYGVVFNANNLANGVYIYKLDAVNFIQSKKMILMK